MVRKFEFKFEYKIRPLVPFVLWARRQSSLVPGLMISSLFDWLHTLFRGNSKARLHLTEQKSNHARVQRVYVTEVESGGWNRKSAPEAQRAWLDLKYVPYGIGPRSKYS